MRSNEIRLSRTVKKACNCVVDHHLICRELKDSSERFFRFMKRLIICIKKVLFWIDLDCILSSCLFDYHVVNYSTQITAFVSPLIRLGSLFLLPLNCFGFTLLFSFRVDIQYLPHLRVLGLFQHELDPNAESLFDLSE